MTAPRYRCPTCGRRKPAEGFYRAGGRRPAGLSYRCRVCTLAVGRDLRAARRAGGLCQCGRARVAGYGTCRVCLGRVRAKLGLRPWRLGGRGRPPGPQEAP